MFKKLYFNFAAIEKFGRLKYQSTEKKIFSDFVDDPRTNKNYYIKNVMSAPANSKCQRKVIFICGCSFKDMK